MLFDVLFAGVYASGTAVASSPRPAPALRSRGWQGRELGPFPAGCQQRWVGAGRAGTGLAAGTAAPRQRHPLPAPAAGSRAGAKAQLGTETLKGSCPGMQRSLVTPNYLLAQTSWQRRFKDSCRADEVTPAPAPLGCSAFPLAEPREEGGGAAWGHGCCQRCCPWHRRHWGRSHHVPGATVPSRTRSWGWLGTKGTWKLVGGKRDRGGGNDALP